MKQAAVRLLCAALCLTLCLSSRAAEHPAYLFGFPDGTLRPEAALTREQLAAIVCRLLPPDALPDPLPRTAYVDVTPRRWSYRAVCTAAALGLWSDVQQPHFAPQQPVTQQELYEVLLRADAYHAEFAEARPPDDPAAVCTREQAAQTINALLGRTEPQPAAPNSAIREASEPHTTQNGAWQAVG